MGVTEFNSDLFALRLNLKMQFFGLSLRNAAKNIGISPATLSRLTTAKNIPDVYTYYACCKWLSLDMDFFFNLTITEV